MDLIDLGWDEWFQQFSELYELPQRILGRVVREQRGVYLVHDAIRERQATAAGRLRHHAVTDSDLPTVGDWVVIREQAAGDARIDTVLPRRSCLSRKVPGKRTQEQLLASNIDILFIVISLDQNYNPRRIERYLTLAESTGTHPVVLLNKADLNPDYEGLLAETQRLAGTVPAHACSASSGVGVEQLRAYLGRGQTAVFLGSSGVGKSSIINQLFASDVQATQPVRERDSRGRHTTTTRQLLVLPQGGAIIDTPGLRELQLWVDNDAVSSSFEDIAAFAQGCRFRDCRHQGEPGCAVRAAAESGELPSERLESYHRQHREVKQLQSRQEEHAQRDEKSQGKIDHKAERRIFKQRGKP